jgi:hypothetical protein
MVKTTKSVCFNGFKDMFRVQTFIYALDENME